MPCTRGRVDFAHAAHPIVTPLQLDAVPSPSLTMKLTGSATPEREQWAVMSASLMSFTRSSWALIDSNLSVISFTQASHDETVSRGSLDEWFFLPARRCASAESKVKHASIAVRNVTLPHRYTRIHVSYAITQCYLLSVSVAVCLSVSVSCPSVKRWCSVKTSGWIELSFYRATLR